MVTSPQSDEAETGRARLGSAQMFWAGPLAGGTFGQLKIFAYSGSIENNSFEDTFFRYCDNVKHVCIHSPDSLEKHLPSNIPWPDMRPQAWSIDFC